MTKFVVVLIVVVAVVAGGLLMLLRSRNAPLPSPEVLDRVKQRNRELDSQDQRERGD